MDGVALSRDVTNTGGNGRPEEFYLYILKELLEFQHWSDADELFKDVIMYVTQFGPIRIVISTIMARHWQLDSIKPQCYVSVLNVG